MENISRIEVYQHLTHNSLDIGLSEKVRSLLDINLALLEGLEGIFLKEHKDSPEELVNRIYKDDLYILANEGIYADRRVA